MTDMEKVLVLKDESKEMQGWSEVCVRKWEGYTKEMERLGKEAEGGTRERSAYRKIRRTKGRREV